MKCPNCSETDLIKCEYELGIGSGVGLRARKQKVWTGPLVPTPYVCKSCGLVSLYINTNKLERKLV